MKPNILYPLDALVLVGAFCISANNWLVFWYCVFGYAAFKTIVVYAISMFRRVELDFVINNEVERKLLKMRDQARWQLARGDHSPIVFSRD